MVDAVHARGGQHAGQDALEPERQAGVAVVEQDGQKEEPLPELERARARAGGEHLERAVGRRDRHVGSVEAERGRAVEIEVDVVDQVEPPQERHFVGQDVPEIDAVIHQQEGGGVTDPGRRRQPLREAETPPLDETGERLDQRRFDELYDGQRAGAEDDVADGALRLCLGRLAQAPLPLGGHDAEDRRRHQGGGQHSSQSGHDS